MTAPSRSSQDGKEAQFFLVIDPQILIRLSVVEGDADPAVQGFLDSPVALGVIAPVQQANQLVTGELDAPIREVLELGKLDQTEEHLVVERGRETILVGPGDRWD